MAEYNRNNYVKSPTRVMHADRLDFCPHASGARSLSEASRVALSPWPGGVGPPGGDHTPCPEVPRPHWPLDEWPSQHLAPADGQEGVEGMAVLVRVATKNVSSWTV